VNSTLGCGHVSPSGWKKAKYAPTATPAPSHDHAGADPRPGAARGLRETGHEFERHALGVGVRPAIGAGEPLSRLDGLPLRSRGNSLTRVQKIGRGGAGIKRRRRARQVAPTRSTRHCPGRSAEGACAVEVTVSVELTIQAARRPRGRWRDDRGGSRARRARGDAPPASCRRLPEGVSSE